MKIVLVGDWHSNIHEEALKAGFLRLGHTVFELKWFKYFNRQKFFDKFQNKFLVGPLIRKIQSDLLKLVEDTRPDFVFIYRGTHIKASTIKKIQKLTTVVSYNNDDPFSLKQPRYYWRHFIASLSYSDIALAYRHHNLDDFRNAGAKEVALLRSWFIPEKDYPILCSETEASTFKHDVVFVGHFENDGREKLFEYLLENGVQLRIYGPDWNQKASLCGPLVKKLLPTKPLKNEDYNKMITSSKISLCLLSKLNRDTYTRRCFEIPAMKGVLLSEYTDDLAGLYIENQEILLFRSKEELLNKIRQYLNDEPTRLKIAENGYKAVYNNKHDNVSRAQEVIGHVKRLKGL